MEGSQSRRVRCAIMRGGTSRGVFVHEVDLPSDLDERHAAILGLIGSPDARQIDGLGGADPLTAKFAIIGPPSRDGTDVDYTFVQVGIENPTLDFLGACGNISSAVGPFAIQEGLVRSTPPVTRVRIHQVNTGRIIVAEVPTTGGVPDVAGDAIIDGVPGTAAPIWMDFAGTLGAGSGRLLPTGLARDTVEVPEIGQITISLIDFGNPVVYVRAQDVGLNGTELPNDYNSRPDVVELLEHIRGQAAVALGWTSEPTRARYEASLHPLLSVISPPADHDTYGRSFTVRAETIDLQLRMQVLQRTHKAISGTGTANVGMAALVPGSIVHEMLGEPQAGSHEFRIGHPSGTVTVQATVQIEEGQPKPERIAFVRTARRIMDGYAYISEARLAQRDAIVSSNHCVDSSADNGNTRSGVT